MGSKSRGSGRMRGGMEEGMSREYPYEVWLCSYPCIGDRKRQKLADCFGGAQGAYFAGWEKWRQVLGEKQADGLREFTRRFSPEEEAGRLLEGGIRLVTERDAQYPKRLRHLPDAPYGLFVRGQLPGREPAAAIVGARDCSGYGAYVAAKLGEILGKNKVTVISGMARGIDGICQQAALDAGGSSCAVLGCGVDICYPSQNRGLYETLADRGCLLSSYPPGTPALPRNFPPRNRIVSGLADAVVVVEAREKSGTLITVDMALEQGRDVYVVPGRITDRLSDGCNRLIRQGAVPLLNPQDLLQELIGKNPDGEPGPEGGKDWGEEGLEDLGGSPFLAALLQALDFSPAAPEELKERLPRAFQGENINAGLMELCLKQRAVQAGPGRFRRKSC